MNARCLTSVRTFAREPRRLLLGAAITLTVLVAGGWWARQYFWIERPLRQARAAWDQGRLAAAAKQLRIGLERAPGHPEMTLWATRVARRLGELDEAAELIQSVAHLHELDPAAWKLEQQLLDVQRRGVNAAAEADLRSQAEQNPGQRPFIYEALAEGYLQDFRISAAVALLDQALAALPDNAVVLRRRGRLHLQLGGFAEALHDLQRAARLDPDDADGQILLADSLVKAGRFGDALPMLERHKQQRPNDAMVLVDLAICAAAAGALDQAQALLVQVLDQQPRHAVALLELGRVYFERGDPKSAETWLQKSLEVDPTDRRANHLLFQSLRLQGKDDQARALQARSERILADLTRLRQIMTDDLVKRPNDPDLFSELGALHLRNGQARQGLHWLEQTLKLDARHRSAHQSLAQYYEKIGQPERAAQHRRQLQ